MHFTNLEAALQESACGEYIKQQDKIYFCKWDQSFKSMCIWSHVNSWNIFIFALSQAFIYTHFWDSCKYYANTQFLLLSAFCRYMQLHSQSLELWPASSHLPFFFEGKKPPHANSNLNSKVFQGLKSHITFLHWNSMLRTNVSPANRETFYHVSVATH